MAKLLSLKVHVYPSTLMSSVPEVIKLFMLDQVEHEILNAHKYKYIKKLGFFRLRLA